MRFQDGQDEINGKIDTVTLDPYPDDITPNHYTFKIVDPIDANNVFSEKMGAHELMRTTLDSAYKLARQKEIYAILNNTAPELKGLSIPEFKSFYKET